jgi:hypothetical protein
VPGETDHRLLSASGQVERKVVEIAGGACLGSSRLDCGEVAIEDADSRD